MEPGTKVKLCAQGWGSNVVALAISLPRTPVAGSSWAPPFGHAGSGARLLGWRQLSGNPLSADLVFILLQVHLLILPTKAV